MPRRASRPAATEGVPPSAAPLTRRFVGLKLFAPFRRREGPYKTESRLVISVNNASRFDNGQITTEPVNRLCRSARSFTRARNYSGLCLVVSQITTIL